MQKTRTDYVILGMLSLGSSLSGYEIRKSIEASMGNFWGESYGQIYPSLRRLVAKALIEKRSATSKPNKRRQEYAITEFGRARLREWLRLPFQNDPPRNEFLLKLFFGGEVGPEVSIGHIREVQRRNQQALEMLLGIESAAKRNLWQDPHRQYWTLTLNLGIALTRTALEWGESALAELGSIEASAAQETQSARAAIETTEPLSTTREAQP
jgi:DNA-binding PadR family transcriptional regulator